MEWIKAKTLLQKVSFDGQLWFGIDYVMNLYKGCNHRCIYCDSRSEKYYIEEFNRVRGKEHTAGILQYELKKNKRGVINFGAMSDAYNAEELRHELTKTALQQIYSYGYGISIETKSNQIVRDIEWIKKIQERASACIKLSIITVDDSLAKVIEPGVCVSSKRFEALQTLSQAGIYTGVLVTPVLPFITDTPENIRGLVRKASESGAKFIYAQFGMTLRDRQRTYYYEKLEESFPGLAAQYKRTYGSSYGCTSPRHEELSALFAEECKKYGLLYKMTDIVADCPKKKEAEQLTLF